MPYTSRSRAPASTLIPMSNLAYLLTPETDRGADMKVIDVLFAGAGLTFAFDDGVVVHLVYKVVGGKLVLDGPISPAHRAAATAFMSNDISDDAKALDPRLNLASSSSPSPTPSPSADLPLAGGTMSGDVDMGGNAITNLSYVAAAAIYAYNQDPSIDFDSSSGHLKSDGALAMSWTYHLVTVEQGLTVVGDSQFNGAFRVGNPGADRDLVFGGTTCAIKWGDDAANSIQYSNGTLIITGQGGMSVAANFDSTAYSTQGQSGVTGIFYSPDNNNTIQQIEVKNGLVVGITPT